MTIEQASALADTVMMEGYALYPYRASAPKNRYRWTFGVLAPRSWSEAGGCEAWWLEAQLLVRGRPRRIAGRLRFFQIERSQRGELPWDEGVLRSVEFDAEHGRERELAFGASLAGRLITRRELVEDARELERVTIRIENTTPWTESGAPRDEAIARAFASTHLVVAAEGGELLSAIDPPPWAAAAAATCTNTRTYPVLVGTDTMLCAPFILYDHPQLAPESTGDLCDATEIDELLVLRTRTLTDAEKREARATSPRTAAIVERADAMPAHELARLHGARRDIRTAGEMTPLAARLAVGARVRLRAPVRRADAQDLLFAGRTATVVDIEHDIDGTVFYAVAIDGDPAAAFAEWYGRHRYYRIDELEPL